ncbi:carboxypeptidase N subunit 2-like [Euwallacea similis]|uniref:carboxypeptidase N subunit 2-like n=1 Tax=Euwallacea similis TaxID=1736056 RepID=UPI0034510DF9
MLSYQVFICSIIFTLTSSFTPNCVRDNQFRFYTFPIKGCSNLFIEKCRDHPSGYLQALGTSSLVKIGATDVIPTCAFHRVRGLRYIFGVNSGIKVLANGAFIDLSQMESVNLAFNSIAEIRKGVFTNVSVLSMDFSWNKILFVDPEAFASVHGLKQLNLSRNSLFTLPVSFFPRTLVHLNVSHNLLSRIVVNSRSFNNITDLDFSNNLIDKIALLFSYPVKLVDLENNKLRDFDYIELTSVELFKIGRNRIEQMPQYLENLNANFIDINENPWQCDQLNLLFEQLNSLGTRLIRKNTSTADCFSLNGTILYQRSIDCTEDYDCPGYMSCRARKCWEFCEHSMCHRTSNCEAKNHKFTCRCPEKLLADPMDVSGECQNVECFMNEQCGANLICKDRKCMEDILFSTAKRLGGQETVDFLGEDALNVEPELPWWYDTIPKQEPSLPVHSAGSSTKQ